MNFNLNLTDFLPKTNEAETVKLVTTTQLAEILKNTVILNKANTFASVIQLTEPKCTVKDRITKVPFFDIVHKLSKVSIILNSQYEVSVVKQLAREDKSPENYKKGQNTMPLTKFDNNLFYGEFHGHAVLEYRPNDRNRPFTQYFLNGKAVEKNQIPDVLPAENHAQNQGTEREIFWRKVYVKNIIQLTMDKVTYKVI